MNSDINVFILQNHPNETDLASIFDLSSTELLEAPGRRLARYGIDKNVEGGKILGYPVLL